MANYYRDQRGGFKESIETMTLIPCKEFFEAYLKAKYESIYDEGDEIEICEATIDKRLPKEWGSIQYAVYIHKKSGYNYPIGYTNFFRF